ncbi:MFS transporter [Pseudohalioglobus sediminis]|uniref:MFS transporter n=1 Tax=Pseudohalioglobus sediminis TaxID=2606449 RepID=A0A5B0X1E6_9GAMM|nr:MFS transporter [Pseudohalioglobus sediminis]KAA1193103.1 MFS transporter [Pseudohalioglobus sediminis]
MKVLLTVTSLLLSTALLLVGHGLQLTLLPLRASFTGMSEFIIGLSASSYFLGFIAGCLLIPLIIRRVGHIRGFAVLTAIMICSLLSLEMLDYWPAWLVLRFLTGVAISGLYTVIESWLNSQATPESRGRILSTYTFITLVAMLAGQFLINVGPVDSSVPFSLATLFLALAILPVGMTRRMAPQPVETTQIRFTLLYKRSRSAFAGALLSGLVAGSFWSLGAVFAKSYSVTAMEITWFMSAAIGGGALLQYPIGMLSDKIDRRLVLALLCIGGALTSAAVAWSIGQAWYLAMVFLFGAMVLPIYAISLATAADVSAPEEFVEIGTSVLLLNAVGAAIAPLPLGQLMAVAGASALFWSFAAICLLMGFFLALQMRHPRTISVEQQTPFEAAGNDGAPVGFELDPRGNDDLEPAPAEDLDELADTNRER